MSGFYRGTQPIALDRAALRGVIVDFIAEAEIATILAAQDPFAIAHDCLSPAGHTPIISGGAIACAHCGRIF